MLIKINTAKCSIFFGNAESCPVSYHNREQFKKFYDGTRKQLVLSHIIFQRQVHGTDGWIITNTQQLTSPVMKEERDGDYLINSVDTKNNRPYGLDGPLKCGTRSVTTSYPSGLTMAERPRRIHPSLMGGNPRGASCSAENG